MSIDPDDELHFRLRNRFFEVHTLASALSEPHMVWNRAFDLLVLALAHSSGASDLRVLELEVLTLVRDELLRMA